MVRFHLEWLDDYLAHAVARHHLDLVGHQLGFGVVLVRSNQETRDDQRLSQIPAPHPRRRNSLLAIDRQGSGGKAALAVWRPRHLRAGGSCPCGNLVYMVGEKPRLLISS
jgi:hypothetical protein